jgi:catechol 2,3-dioxygenase-like lactoylglutathione lyase family enzyme
VADVKQALGFYRDTLGWEEAWREGETTTSLGMPRQPGVTDSTSGPAQNKVGVFGSMPRRAS